MAREEEIIKTKLFFDSIPEGCDFDRLGHTTRLATQLYDAGWHKQIEAEWIPNDVYYSPMNCYMVLGYTCSNCKTKTDNYSNYCSYCGAKMTIKGE